MWSTLKNSRRSYSIACALLRLAILLSILAHAPRTYSGTLPEGFRKEWLSGIGLLIVWRDYGNANIQPIVLGSFFRGRAPDGSESIVTAMHVLENKNTSFPLRYSIIPVAGNEATIESLFRKVNYRCNFLENCQPMAKIFDRHVLDAIRTMGNAEIIGYSEMMQITEHVPPFDQASIRVDRLPANTRLAPGIPVRDLEREPLSIGEKLFVAGFDSGTGGMEAHACTFGGYHDLSNFFETYYKKDFTRSRAIFVNAICKTGVKNLDGYSGTTILDSQGRAVAVQNLAETNPSAPKEALVAIWGTPIFKNAAGAKSGNPIQSTPDIAWDRSALLPLSPCIIQSGEPGKFNWADAFCGIRFDESAPFYFSRPK